MPKGAHDFVITPYSALNIKRILWDGRDTFVLWPGCMELITQYLRETNSMDLIAVCNFRSGDDKPVKVKKYFVNLVDEVILSKQNGKGTITSSLWDIWPVLIKIHNTRFFRNKTVEMSLYRDASDSELVCKVRIHDADIMSVHFQKPKDMRRFFRIVAEYIACDCYSYPSAWLKVPDLKVVQFIHRHQPVFSDKIYDVVTNLSYDKDMVYISVRNLRVDEDGLISTPYTLVKNSANFWKPAACESGGGDNWVALTEKRSP